MKPLEFFPIAASQNAHGVDALFLGLVAVSLIFAVPICMMIIFFAVRYRHGRKANRTSPPPTNAALEIAWMLPPLVIGVGLFIWASRLYVTNSEPPADALDIYVVGKQWMWKIQHPQGRREIDELHVPLGRDIKLTMTSEDVIHDFYIPAFRLKQDVLPGRYTQMWFRPTRLGTYHLFCAEYCGTFHSRMGGSVVVMKPADYARWLRAGNEQPTMEKSGEKLFTSLGCSGCHGDNSNVRAPSLNGIYNQPVALQNPNGTNTVVTADDRYLRDSILLPASQIAAGYKNIMPTYKGSLNEEQLLQLIQYIKSLSRTETVPQNSNGMTNNGKDGNAAQSAYTHQWAQQKPTPASGTIAQPVPLKTTKPSPTTQ